MRSKDLLKGGISASRLVDDIRAFEFGSHYLGLDPIDASRLVSSKRREPLNFRIVSDKSIPPVFQYNSTICYYALLVDAEDENVMHHLTVQIIPGYLKTEQLDLHLAKAQTVLTETLEAYEYLCSVSGTRVKLTFRRPILSDEVWDLFTKEAIDKRFKDNEHLRPGSQLPTPFMAMQTLYKIISKPMTDSDRVAIQNKSFSVNVRLVPNFLTDYLYFEHNTDNDTFIPPDIRNPTTDKQLDILLDYYCILHEVVTHTLITHKGNVPSSSTHMPLFKLQDSIKILKSNLNDLTNSSSFVTPVSPLPSYNQYVKRYTSWKEVPPHAKEARDSAEVCLVILGATMDLNDHSIIDRYDLQTQNDRRNAPYYFEALQNLASSRRSETLEMKAVELLSLGEITSSDLENAYKVFGFSFQTDDPKLVNSELLSRYEQRLEFDIQNKTIYLNSLRKIANYLGNHEILSQADAITMSEEDAFNTLGIDKSSTDNFVQLAYLTKVTDLKPSETARFKFALRNIAITRKCPLLLTAYEDAVKDEPENPVNGIMSLSDSYALLGASVDGSATDDKNSDPYPFDMLTALYKVRIEDNPREIFQYRKALRSIAIHRKINQIEQFLKGEEITNRASVSEWPVGLQNIGNTCYLNSLLQYYFSITPIREAVITFHDENEDKTIYPKFEKEKRVGGREVSKAEILRSRKFVVLLGELFKWLVHSPEPSIRPRKELAFMALVTAAKDPDEQKYYEMAQRIVAGLPPIENDKALISISESHYEAVEKNQDSAAIVVTNATDDEFSSSEDESDNRNNHGTVIVHEQDFDDSSSTKAFPREDEEGTVEIITTSTTTGTTATTKEIKSSNTKKNGSIQALSLMDVDTKSFEEDETMGVPASPKRTADSANETGSPRKKDKKESESKPDDDIDMDDSTEANEKKTEETKKPEPESFLGSGEPKMGMEEALQFGGQQDVTECIENVLFQIEGAFEPLGYDSDGEQQDMVKELFYGTTKQSLEDADTGESLGDDKTERFSMLIVSMKDKPLTVYDVIDNYFEDSIVELGAKNVLRRVSATKFPPILQLQMQRVQFDIRTKQVYKSISPLRLLDTIYVDRYLETSDPIILSKRQEVAKWKAELMGLRKEFVEMSQKTSADLSVIDTLESAKQILQMQNAQEDSVCRVSEATIEFLDKHIAQYKSRLEFVQDSISVLESKLATQFDDPVFHKLGYRLHAVFIHRGQVSYGHYWIYIRDFKKGVFRKYNDAKVTEIPESEVTGEIIEDRNATAYYVTYVREDQIDNLVQAVVRDVEKVEDVTPSTDEPTNLDSNQETSTSNEDLDRDHAVATAVATMETIEGEAPGNQTDQDEDLIMMN